MVRMSFLDAREHGAKAGSGGVASAQQEAIDRRERLRRLALETIDLAKDPYYMRNHLGQIECRLCLTLHNNEGNYLAHTQGKRHQQNLAKRAAREAAEKAVQPAPQRRLQSKKIVRIGRPGYRVIKQYDPEYQQRCLLFQIEYPEIEDDTKPRHRFMSAYEQRVEAADKKYQYLLFAADPYETIGFKIPNMEVEKLTKDGTPRFFSHWDPDSKTYSLQIPFRNRAMEDHMGMPGLPPPPPFPGAMMPPPMPPMGMRPPPPPGMMAPPLPSGPSAHGGPMMRPPPPPMVPLPASGLPPPPPQFTQMPGPPAY